MWQLSHPLDFFSLVPRPHPAHMRRRGLVSQVQILGILWSVVILSAAHVRGTEIIAQKTFILTQEEIEIKFEGYGLQLHVPANSLPTNISETQLNVQVSLSGPFQIPSNSELLSAVYWIFSPTKFAKPITVRIQHCAALTSDKQCSKVTFIRIMCTQNNFPHMFQQLPGGVFKPHDSYACIVTYSCASFKVFCDNKVHLPHIAWFLGAV